MREPEMEIDEHSLIMRETYMYLFLQISRSIGDVYLKKAKFNKEPLLAKFKLPKTFCKPILSANPLILVQKIYPQDQFLIFATYGLWEHLSNQEAVKIVHHYPQH
ncbi:hypothetical protein GIB67_012407, partial [Kingdonia uniflora]